MAPSERGPTARSPRRGRIALGALFALALPAALACNSIIGLSDFEKGQCPGAKCADDGGFPDQLADGGGGDAPLDVQVDVRGTDPVSWAKWPMPNYGEGGAGDPPYPQNLVEAGAGVVNDKITKLAWRAQLASSGVAQAAAEGECKKLGSWRVPKRIELVTLLDYAKSQPPYVDGTKFPDIRNDVVWTSSEVRPIVVGKPDQPYWVVNFATGAVEPLRADFKASVLCVAAK